MNAARFLKYVWPFYNIMHERVNRFRATRAVALDTSKASNRAWHANQVFGLVLGRISSFIKNR